MLVKERVDSNARVELLWHPKTDICRIVVTEASGESFRLECSDRADALDKFDHPYVYRKGEEK